MWGGREGGGEREGVCVHARRALVNFLTGKCV
jgi:hypothetical protein